MATSLPTTMKALIKKTESESYQYIDMAVPEPAAGEVLINVDSVAICDSDVVKIVPDIPFIPGHQAAGTVVKCGTGTSVAIGTRVGVENHFFCGDCYHCNHDLKEICPNMGQYGFGRKTIQGWCSEYSTVRKQYRINKMTQ